MAVLARTTRDGDVVANHGEVKSGRRNINPTRLNTITVPRVTCREIAGTLENLRQHAADSVGQMQGDENCRWKIRPNVFDDALKGTDPAGRCADDDDVEIRHWSPGAKGGTYRR